MTTPHGKGVNVLVDGTDLSAYFNSFSSSRGVDTSDVTTYTNDDRVFIAGLEMGSMQLGGFWDGDAGAVDAILAGLFNSDNTPVISTFVASYDTLGNNAVMLGGYQTDYSVDVSVDDAVSLSASAEASGGLRNGGEVVHVLQARTGTFNGTSINDGASSAYGGAAHLHVTAFTGTDVDIKLQDSPNDSTWADLVDWSGTAATGGYRSTVTGTVDQYLRVIISGGTFSSVTFAVCFARNRR